MHLHLHFSISGPALLTVDKDHRGTVQVYAQSEDGCVPSLIEVTGQPELLQAALRHKFVQLEMSGLRFRSSIAGKVKGSDELFVVAAPLFQAIARQLKTRASH